MAPGNVNGFRVRGSLRGRARIPAVVTLIGMLLLAVPLFVLPGNDDASALPQSVLLQAGVSLLWVIRLVARDRGLRWPAGTLPLLLLLGWAALSLVWVTDRFLGVQVLSRWLAAAALFLLVADEVDAPVQARWLLTCVFAAGAAVAGIGLLQQMAGLDFVPQAFPPAGTLANKNVAAGFVAVTLPIGLALAWGATGLGPSILFSVAFGASLAYLRHADCRGAFAALGAEGLVALLLLRGSALPRAWTPRRAVGLASGLLAFGLLSPTLHASAVPGSAAVRGASVADERASRSVAIRFGVWRNTLELIRERPFRGAGLAGFRAEYPRVAGRVAADGVGIDQRVESAHNDYLQGVAELGLPGAFLLLSILAAGLRVVARVAESGGDAGSRFLVSLSAIGLVGLLVQAVFSPTFTQPALLATTAVLGGVAAGLARISTSLSRRVEIALLSSTRVWRPGLALAACALVVASVSGVREIVADRHRLAMAEAAAREDWSAVVSEGLEARRWNPGRTDLCFSMGTSLLRLGRAEDAARLFEELVAVDPFNANALGNLAIALERSGDRARATAQFERVRRLRPADAGARDGLLRLASNPESPERSRR